MSDLFKQLESVETGRRVPLDGVLDAVRFNDDGLVPAVAQRQGDGRVLMLAWMSRESICETLRTGRVCYWSRSRRQLWRKGEQSGHVQQLVEMRIDCDGDALLLIVDQTGPACHTDRPACFYLRVDAAADQVSVEPER